MSNYYIAPAIGLRMGLRNVLCLGLSGFLLVAFAGLGPAPVRAESSTELRETIQQQLRDLTLRIDVLNQDIEKARAAERTLKRELFALTKSIDKLQLEIERTSLQIAETEEYIKEIEGELADLQKREIYERGVLAELIRNVDREDDVTLIELILSANRLSGIWDRLQAFINIQGRIQNEIANIRILRQKQDEELAKLETKRQEELALRRLQESQEAELEHERTAKESLFANVRHQNRFLRASLISNQTLVERLQRQLFLLEGLGITLPLEEAVAKAKILEEKTGVRIAFLLAVLQKESQWGAGVGTGNWREDMHPRDYSAFLQITSELGLNPDLVPVSAKPAYGWGGAMGPAQFLPSTWLAWKDKIVDFTGHNPPSPWSIDDAFAAAALKLAASGAAQKTPDAERRAAMIYFAGGNWDESAFRWYGESVMELAALLEEEIEKPGV